MVKYKGSALIKRAKSKEVYFSIKTNIIKVGLVVLISNFFIKKSSSVK